MIGTSSLGSSSFDVDPIISESFNVFDIDQFEVEIAALETNESSCSSPIHSSSSSDDCDWSTLNDILPIAETIASELFENEESLIDSLSFTDSDWVALTDSLIDETPTIERVSKTFETPKKKLKPSKSSQSAPSLKPWSKMSINERLKIANGLSEIVSHRMSLAHQIEVIKLIDPSADLSPNTTEFTVNLYSLNDEKIKRIQEYIRKYAVFEINPDTNQGKKHRGVSSYNSSSSSESSCLSKRRQKKYKAASNINHIKLKKMKYRHQGQKEEQSGLFVMEKVIKKLSNPSEEDEDVNILD